MERAEITSRRLSNQHVGLESRKSPEEVLSSLGAVQAQDYPAALWAIGLRCGSKKNEVEKAIAKKRISRTWLMRGTLHFASSRDVHWMLRLFAPRLRNTTIARDRRLGLGDGVIRKAEDLFASALRGNRQLTRDEMYEVLDRGGVSIAGNLGYHLLYRAAWDGVICFGSHEGRQPTFELLEERIVPRLELSREQALAELASRYFTSHGPATVKDFTWWSGLKVSDAKAGIESASPSLSSDEIGGKTFYMGRTSPKNYDNNDRRVHLLPAFDEYLVGYSDRSDMLSNPGTRRILRSGKVVFTHSNGIFLPMVVADGEVVGSWKRRSGKGMVTVEIRRFAKLDDELEKGVADAARRYGEFLKVPVALTFDS